MNEFLIIFAYLVFGYISARYVIGDYDPHVETKDEHFIYYIVMFALWPGFWVTYSMCLGYVWIRDKFFSKKTS